MATFHKIIHGVDFAFTLNHTMKEPAIIVELENYDFVMVAIDDHWKSIFDVPIWIKNLEEKLSEAIEMQLKRQEVLVSSL